MMNCQEFKKWLIDRDDLKAMNINMARTHMQQCSACHGLYDRDQSIEAILKAGLQSIAPPPGLVARTRRNVELKSGRHSLRSLILSWKVIGPAIATAFLALFLVMNPLSGQLHSIDDMVSHSITNHLNTEMIMEYRKADIAGAGVWFSKRLGFDVRLPDFKQLGITFTGGRKCKLGKVDAGYFYCNASGKKASLFLINSDDVSFTLTDKREYVTSDSHFTVRIWKDAGVVYALVV